MEISTKEEIFERRKEIEQEFLDLIREHQSDFDLDYIKKVIYRENDNDDLMKIVAVFDRGNPLEMENILDLATDAWNYFPHKALSGLCPMDVILKHHKKK